MKTPVSSANVKIDVVSVTKWQHALLQRKMLSKEGSGLWLLWSFVCNPTQMPRASKGTTHLEYCNFRKLLKSQSEHTLFPELCFPWFLCIPLEFTKALRHLDEKKKSLNNTQLCRCTTAYLPIHLLKDILVASKFWQLVFISFYHRTCKILDGFPWILSTFLRNWDSNSSLKSRFIIPANNGSNS